eukprot:2978804-Pleurochrysis_carterae.AAC.1
MVGWQNSSGVSSAYSSSRHSLVAVHLVHVSRGRRSELRVDQTPIGSGCIAQVYRGELRQPDGSWLPVAVKARTLTRAHIHMCPALFMCVVQFEA